MDKFKQWVTDNPKLAMGGLFALLFIIAMIVGVSRAEAQVVSFGGYYGSVSADDSPGGLFIRQGPGCHPPMLCLQDDGVSLVFTWQFVCTDDDCSTVRDELRAYTIEPFVVTNGQASVMVKRELARDFSSESFLCALFVDSPLAPSPAVSQAENASLVCDEFTVNYSGRF